MRMEHYQTMALLFPQYPPGTKNDTSMDILYEYVYQENQDEFGTQGKEESHLYPQISTLCILE